MNNQKGFTLIELIVVIVILGILAAVAVPKFVDMQGEAKRGVLNGIRGSLKSAVMMAHGKYLAGGGTATSITVDGATVDLAFGYPEASTANLTALVDLDNLTIEATDADDFLATSTETVLTVTYGAYSFTYTEATATTRPTVSAVAP
ncbi:MAG: type II secretion system protein [Desulfuromonas thiophila]|nr:type II secretion system protein [Desulfuromonas thiophila]